MRIRYISRRIRFSFVSRDVGGANVKDGGRPVVATMQRRRRQEDGGHKIFVVRDKISNLSRLFCLIELFKTSDKS